MRESLAARRLSVWIAELGRGADARPPIGLHRNNYRDGGMRWTPSHAPRACLGRPGANRPIGSGEVRRQLPAPTYSGRGGGEPGAAEQDLVEVG